MKSFQNFNEASIETSIIDMSLPNPDIFLTVILLMFIELTCSSTV